MFADPLSKYVLALRFVDKWFIWQIDTHNFKAPPVCSVHYIQVMADRILKVHTSLQLLKTAFFFFLLERQLRLLA